MLRARRRPRPLLRARRLLARGRFAEAGELFDRLAQGAEERGMVARAGRLNLEAARCYLQLDDLDSAYERARKGLRSLAQVGQGGRVRRFAPRVIQALEERGRHEEAEELKREWEGVMGPPPRGEAPVPSGPVILHQELPDKCPHCSAPLKEEEVNWVGPLTAECPYCGGSVKLTLRKV